MCESVCVRECECVSESVRASVCERVCECVSESVRASV